MRSVALRSWRSKSGNSIAASRPSCGLRSGRSVLRAGVSGLRGSRTCVGAAAPGAPDAESGVAGAAPAAATADGAAADGAAADGAAADGAAADGAAGDGTAAGGVAAAEIVAAIGTEPDRATSDGTDELLFPDALIGMPDWHPDEPRKLAMSPNAATTTRIEDRA